jgi:hypothetical protein
MRLIDKLFGKENSTQAESPSRTGTTRVHSGGWHFDGTEHHRPAVDRSEHEGIVRFHPRVDVRHKESLERQETYRLAPGKEELSFATAYEAHRAAEKGRDEWERGKRSLYPVRETDRREIQKTANRDKGIDR